MDAETNPTRGFANHGTILQGVVDTLDRVILHAEQETGAELGVGGPSVEKGGRGVREVPLRH